MVLRQMQNLLEHCYEARSDYDIYDFLTTDRRELGLPARCTDEQVLVAETDDGAKLGVFIDAQVLGRLAQHNPLDDLSETNLSDYCTAFEGVSHFQYLTWRIAGSMPVSLLELELQAEVDKYVGAMILFTRQREGKFPAQLHRQMFARVEFAAGLDREAAERYRIANRNAARYCGKLDERFLKARRKRPDVWLSELRRFYRCGHAEKVRRAGE
jgi:hypothetical protein